MKLNKNIICSSETTFIHVDQRQQKRGAEVNSDTRQNMIARGEHRLTGFGEEGIRIRIASNSKYAAHSDNNNAAGQGSQNRLTRRSLLTIARENPYINQVK